MQKSLRMTILAIAAVFLTSSLALAAQTTPTPAPDGGTAAPQHHARASKRKHSAKKGARKKGRKKSTSTEPK
jgi:hypothetical protein